MDELQEHILLQEGKRWKSASSLQAVALEQGQISLDIAGLEQVIYPISVQLCIYKLKPMILPLCPISRKDLFSYTGECFCYCHSETRNNTAAKNFDFSFFLSCQYLLIALRKEKLNKSKIQFPALASCSLSPACAKT